LTEDGSRSYRILADENLEPPTVRQLRKLGHDVERVVDVLETGVSDEQVAEYAEEDNRLILTYDDDLIEETDMSITGVLLQVDGSLSAKEVGDIVHEMSEYIKQDEVRLEYVSRNWL
jgi:predicted nuclease of predicted toxin-antitoxin system